MHVSSEVKKFKKIGEKNLYKNSIFASCSQYRKVIKLTSGFVKYEYTFFQVLSVFLIDKDVSDFLDCSKDYEKT